MLHKMIFFAALVAGSHLASGQAAPVAIVNARIEIGNGNVVERGTVVVREGKIFSVNTDAPPTGVAVFDARGLTLYPGFIDAYSSRGVSLPATASVGTAPESRTQAPPYMWEGNRKGIRAQASASTGWKISDYSDNYKQGILAALVAPGTGLIRGSAAVVTYAKSPVTLIANAGMEISPRSAGGGGGGTSQGYPASLLGSVALCRQFLWDSKTYGEQKSLGARPVKDEGYEAMQPVLRREVPALIEGDSDREAFRALNLADEFGLRLILKGGREAALTAADLKAHDVSLLLRIDYVDPPDRKMKTDPDATPQAVLDDRYVEWKRRLANPKRLANAGLRFGFTSDGSLVDDYLSNVRKVVNVGGLPRDVALKAMTSDAAAILGVADKLGTIEAGKIANLVLMNGDFAKDGTAVQSVFVAGERVDVAKKAEAKS